MESSKRVITPWVAFLGAYVATRDSQPQPNAREVKPHGQLSQVRLLHSTATNASNMTQPRVQGCMSGTQTAYPGPACSRLSRKALVFFFCTTRRRQHARVTSETCSIRILSLPTNGRRLLEQSGGTSLRDPALGDPRPWGQPRGRPVLCHMMLGIFHGGSQHGPITLPSRDGARRWHNGLHCQPPIYLQKCLPNSITSANFRPLTRAGERHRVPKPNDWSCFSDALPVIEQRRPRDRCSCKSLQDLPESSLFVGTRLRNQNPFHSPS